MKRESEAALLDFCAGQKGDFRAADWLGFDRVRRDELAAMCLFLSSTLWYGHREELLEVAEALVPGCAARPSALILAADLDRPRLSAMLRRELEHAPSAS